MTELDSRPTAWTGWYPTVKLAVEAARTAVTAASEPLLMAVMDEERAIHRVAREDHPNSENADELVEVMR